MKLLSYRHGGVYEYLRANISVTDILDGAKVGDKVYCVFHEDTDPPDMHVYPDGVHCFACGYHSDVTGVWKEMHGFTSMWDAAQDLAAKFNLQLPQMSPEARARYEERRRKEDEHTKLALERHAALKNPEDPRALRVQEYLNGRCITDEIRDKYKLGMVAPGDLNIPFWVGTQVHGQVIRRLEGREPKYLAPTKDDFPLGRRPILMVGNPQPVPYLLVEGYLDQPAAEVLGIPAIGTGAGLLSNEQVEDLRTIGEQGATFSVVPDDDPEGTGLEYGLTNTRKLYPYAFLTPPIPVEGVKDVSDLYAHDPDNAAEILKDLMDQGQDALELALSELKELKGRKKAIHLKKHVIPLLLQLDSEAERQAVITDVAKEAGLSKENINRARAEVEGSQLLDSKHVAPADLPETEWADLLEPGVLDRYVKDAAAAKGAVGDMSAVKVIKLAEAGAQLGVYPNGTPVGTSVMLSGQQGVGKNYAADVAVALSPEEWYLAFEVASSQAFYYAVQVSPDFLKHRFLYPNEVEAVDTVVEFLRPMLSQARARKYVTNKDSNGAHMFDTFDVEGPITGVIPTVRNKLDAQLQTRLAVVEMTKQDHQIASHSEALSAQLSPSAWTSDKAGVKLLWQAALRSLTGVRKAVSDIADWGRGKFRFENEDIDHGARVWRNLLGLMAAHAWLEQRNREIRELADGTKAVVATAEDYEVAYKLFKAVGKRTIVPIGEEHRAILQAVYELAKDADFPEDGFTQRQIAEQAGINQSTVSRSKSYLVMSVGMLYETEKKLLALPKGVEPEDWTYQDPMKGFPTPDQVRGWGPTPPPPSGPVHQRINASGGEKADRNGAEADAQPCIEPASTRITSESSAEPRSNRLKGGAVERDDVDPFDGRHSTNGHNGITGEHGEVVNRTYEGIKYDYITDKESAADALKKLTSPST